MDSFFLRPSALLASAFICVLSYVLEREYRELLKQIADDSMFFPMVLMTY